MIGEICYHDRPDGEGGDVTAKQHGSRRRGVPDRSLNATEATDPGEPVSVERWQARLKKLLSEIGNREEAEARLVAKLDRAVHQWVCSKLESLAGATSIDRYDSLARIERRIREVAKSVLGHLNIAGGRHFHVLPDSLEAISAEVQYAEMKGTHDQRLGMLRLDRQREQRYAELLALTAQSGDVEVLLRSDIEPWYEMQLRGVLGVAETE